MTVARSGDMPKAKAAYQDFLTLWTNADQDIPILIEAQQGVRGTALGSLADG